MTRHSALARKEQVRRPRERLKAALKILPGGAGKASGCHVAVIYADGAVRFEVHHETKANGRSCWYAVAVYAGELHDVRRATRRWEALAICQSWIRN